MNRKTQRPTSDAPNSCKIVTTLSEKEDFLAIQFEQNPYYFLSFVLYLYADLEKHISPIEQGLAGVICTLGQMPAPTKKTSADFAEVFCRANELIGGGATRT
jgi:hypothetical protein